MITARPRLLYRLFFGWYFRYRFRQQFAGFRGVLPSTDPELPLCWIANHTGWWDGIWPLLLNAGHEKRSFYVLMLERELAKRPFLRRLGAFSVAPGKRSVADTVAYLTELLARQHNTVLVYPQGQIESTLRQDIRFETGLLHRLVSPGASLQVLMSAFFVDYGDSPKPLVYHYHKLLRADAATIRQLEQEYREFYDRARQEHIEMMHLQHKYQEAG